MESKTSLGTLTTECPVCGNELVVEVRTTASIHTKVYQDEDRVEHSGRLLVSIDWESVKAKIIAQHPDCFVVDDETLAALEAYDAQLAAAREAWELS